MKSHWPTSLRIDAYHGHILLRPENIMAISRDPILTALLGGQCHRQMTWHQQVWCVCCRIPQGKVATYGQLARWLGRPRAARAVGQALNRNPYAPTVPCHRVVGHDGSLTGFADGLIAKESLLKREGVLFRGRKVDLAQSQIRSG